MERGLTQSEDELARLRECVDFFRTMVDHSPHWEYWQGAESEILYMSVAAERVTGYPRGEFISDPDLIRRIVHPDERALMDAHLRDSAEVGAATLQYRIVRRDGAVRWMEHACQPVQSDTGRFLGRRVCNVDITDRKRDEDALRFQSMVLDQIADAVTATDLQGTITYVNASQAETLGFSKEALIGQPVESYGQDSVHGPTQAEVIAATLSDGQWTGELVNTNARGEDVVMASKVRLIRDTQGRPIGMCGSGANITERKRSERRQALLTEISRYLNVPGDTNELTKNVLLLLQDHTGIEAVGLRVLDGEDFPYIQTSGFSREFVELERRLCARDGDGAIVRDDNGIACLVCTCGAILRGRTDAEHSFFTKGGSFWTNCASQLAADNAGLDFRIRPRNRCVVEGYESVALIPLRSGDQTLGLLQLNDRRRDMFTLEFIELLEGVAANIGIAVARNQMHTALREREELYRSLIEGTPDVIAIFDRAGRHIFISSAIAAMLGRSPEEFVGKTHSELGFTEEQAQYWGQCIQSVFETGEPFETEYEFAGPNGPVLLNWRLIPVRTDGEVTSVLSISRDNTAERLAVRDYQYLSREMLDGFALHEMIFDEAGHAVDYRFLAVNPAFERHTGLSAANVIGKTALEVLPNLERQWFDTYQRVVTTGEPALFENHSHELDRYFEVTAFRVAPNQFASIFADITDRRKAEAERERLQAQLNQAQKLEAIGRLAGGVAHDFNNMLAVITGYTEMAISQLDPAHPACADLQEVRSAARRSTDVTRQLLAFARKQIVLPRVLDLNETVEGMLKMLRRLIGEDIELAWHPAARLWPVHIDPSQIDQILANLCVNARDAIAGVGIVTVETGVRSYDQTYCANHPGCAPGDYVLLSVRDTGCGMDGETVANVFEPFFTTKEQGQGTGLGLATVYGAVKQNQGFITVESAPGHGACFQIFLPRYAADFMAPAADEPVAPPARGHETVLIVEDEVAILNLGKRILEDCGYTALMAATPGEAILLVEHCADPIHLLLTDVIMPEMSGVHLAERLTALRPSLKRVFMSGYTADTIARHGVLEAGVSFLHKPFTKSELAAKIREALDQR